MRRSPQVYAPVQSLNADVVDRIAAGEVVERPASALKEMIENSIDANARRIKVQIVGGGVQQLEVEDDGWGMTQKDLQECLKRHATSKIRGVDDLDRVMSLGFRGEALAALSSISRLKIESFSEHKQESWTLKSEGSERFDVIPSRRKRGTRIVASDLFFNVPARKKFLKTLSSEATLCRKYLKELALSHPELHFEYYIVNEKGEVKDQQKWSAETHLKRSASVWGWESSDLAEVKEHDLKEGVRSLRLIYSLPPRFERNSQSIYLFVNGRCVYDKRLSFSLREAYSGLIEVGAFPAVAVFIEVDPELIDINVHPQKREVRWPAKFSLPSLVYKALYSELQKKKSEMRRPAPTPVSIAPKSAGLWKSPSLEKGLSRELFSGKTKDLGSKPPVAPLRVVSKDENLVSLGPDLSVSAESGLQEQSFQSEYQKNSFLKFSELRVVGELGAAWILCEGEGRALIIIDPHAAHERIRFEEILKKKTLLRSKPLLIPDIVKLPIGLQDRKPELKEALESLGFEFTDPHLEGKDSLEILAIPSSDRKLNWVVLLEKLFSRLEEGLPWAALKEKCLVDIAASLACHGSVRQGQRLDQEQIKALLKSLDSLEGPTLCPHGRPFYHVMSHQSLEELFHRS